MDDRDLFSYDNSNNGIDEAQENFDLNSFSTQTEEESSLPKNKKGKNIKQNILKISLTVFLVGIITFALVVGGFLFYAFNIVDGSMAEYDLNDLKSKFTTIVYVQNADGEWVETRRLHGEYNRIWVEYDEYAIENGDEDYKGIPANLANAFVAIEDKGFKEHYGIDWKRTFGAVLNEFFHFSPKFGGSTITQQLVKNLTKDSKQDAGRKLREIMRARDLETNYSKDVILECYLNEICLGTGIYGVQTAANYYFSKDVHELTVAECASLAAITKEPAKYSPTLNMEENKKRRDTVLSEMYSQGHISKKEYDEAVESAVELKVDKSVISHNEVNSYFVDALIDQVIDDLRTTYGYTQSKAEEVFYTSGCKIYATIDPEIQAIVEEEYEKLASKAQKSQKGDPLWGAMTVMDYEGNVKAIVGGIGEKTSNRSFNCATDSKRQPGSTIKPLAVYAPAIEQNLITYSTILNDTKIKYGNWSPSNAGGGYSGNITAQYALKVSKNTIPVKLAFDLKIENCYNYLIEKFGLKNLTELDNNPSSVALGGTNGGVTTLESAAAYAVFGNGGRYYTPKFYSKVTDQKGNVILEKKNKPITAISEDTATVMNKMLQTVIYESGGTGNSVKSTLSNMKLFGKTGTSSENMDKWFVGGSPYYVVSSWCGYETMQKLPSANLNIAKDMWSTVMKKIHKGLKKKEFPESAFVEERYFCEESGGLATDECKKKKAGWYKTSNIPAVCPKHSGVQLGTPEEIKKAEEEAKKEEAKKENQSGTSSDSSTSSKPSTTPPTSSENTGSSTQSSSDKTTSGE